MKRYLLLAGSVWLCGFVTSPAQSPEPATLKARSSTVFERLAASMEPANLLRSYPFKISKVTYNQYEPAVRDLLLTVTTTAEYPQLLKNRYSAFLIKSDLISTKISFGQRLRIGASQAIFCRAYYLSPNYQAHEITDAPEETGQLHFSPAGSKLQKVSCGCCALQETSTSKV